MQLPFGDSDQQSFPGEVDGQLGDSCAFGNSDHILNLYL